MAYKKFKVTGHGEFPIDMLRYDRAYPASETDSQILGSCRVGVYWEVTLVTEYKNAPRIRRWESFGCKVNQ